MIGPDVAALDETTTLDEWLGGEPNLLDVEVELEGVKDILAALTEEEMKEMKDTTMPIRYFRAEKGNTTKAIEKLRSTLKWRKEFRVDDIINCMKEGGDEEILKDITGEYNTGITYVRGYDENGRAIICVNAAVKKSENILAQQRASVHLLEKAIACTSRMSQKVGGKPLEKFIIAATYGGYTSASRPPLKVLKGLNDIFSNHYPERLENLYLIDPPLVFRAFWTLVRPFLDSVTKAKVVMCVGDNGIEQLTARVKNVDKLGKSFGGTLDVRPFDTQEYFRLPLDFCFDE